MTTVKLRPDTTLTLERYYDDYGDPLVARRLAFTLSHDIADSHLHSCQCGEFATVTLVPSIYVSGTTHHFCEGQCKASYTDGGA